MRNLQFYVSGKRPIKIYSCWVQPLKIFSVALTHWGRVTHIYVSKLTIIGSDNDVAWSAAFHYLNQYWIIVNWTLRNKLPWNLNRNSNIFIQENAFVSVVCETAAILSRPQCIKRCRFFQSGHRNLAEPHDTIIVGESTVVPSCDDPLLHHF